MANKNISDLPAASALTVADLLEVEQGGVNGQLTGQQLKTFISTTIAASGNVFGVGSPVGVVTPAALGQFYSDVTSSPASMWQSTGLTNISWFQWI